ncbi:MAG TPA: hypothetical protein EYH30_00520 [Anaerolineales bacterium]|nr:hypothetical protein [Anaerolineae bacterium]HIQ00610.1 hypothetical protein [Anaerolineales bacterium]
MNPPGDLLSRLVAAFDRLMRWRLGIWEYTDDLDCIFRVALIRPRRRIELDDGTVLERGEVIGMIHAWNEHVPPLPPTGPDLAWARELRWRAIHSLRLLARAAQEDPRLKNVRGFGGAGSLEFGPATLRLLKRLGIETHPLPPRTVYDHIEEKVSLIWTWLIRRTFNPPSVQGRGPEVLKRRFYWLSRERLLALYGPTAEPGEPAERIAAPAAENPVKRSYIDG